MEAVPQETVEKLMGNVPAQKELEGIRILASSPGSVRYEIDVPDNVLNYHGCIHGGFVSTMLEIAAGMATYAYGESNVAVSCATNFVRAVRPQRLTVSADTSQGPQHVGGALRHRRRARQARGRVHVHDVLPGAARELAHPAPSVSVLRLKPPSLAPPSPSARCGGRGGTRRTSTRAGSRARPAP